MEILYDKHYVINFKKKQMQAVYSKMLFHWKSCQRMKGKQNVFHKASYG